ncbi:MAG: hypothetical protein ACTH0V_00225 [Microbacteriaceae bacterium]
MSDLRLLPYREVLDRWMRRMRHSHDLAGVKPGEVDVPVAIVQLPTHAALAQPHGEGRALRAWVTWSEPTVRIVPAGSVVHADWSIRADGDIVARGTATIDHSTSGAPWFSDLPPALPEGVDQVRFDIARRARALRQRIEELAADGLMAEFEALDGLAPFIRDTVRRKNCRVAAEIIHADQPIDPSSQRAPVVIDGLREEEVVDEMTVGRPGQQTTAFLFRALRQAAHGDVLERVPVSHYLQSRIAAEAEVAIRRVIGDPNLGRRLRREWRSWAAGRDSGAVDPKAEITAFINHWNTTNPGSRVGVKVATSAITAGPDALVDHVSLNAMWWVDVVGIPHPPEDGAE